MTSTRAIPAPAAEVWTALNDPEMLKSCISGCESIEPDGENAYRIVAAAKVGPVSARFTGKIQLADIDPPRAYTIRFDGSGGSAGFVKGEARVTLPHVVQTVMLIDSLDMQGADRERILAACRAAPEPGVGGRSA